MRKGVLATLIPLLSLAVLAAACGGGGDGPTATPRPAPTNTPAAATISPPSGGGEVVNITQTENPYVFIPDTYDLALGKTYTLKFVPTNEFHTFNVDELGIEIFINVGESVQQDITPTEAGTFKLYCVPHQGLGMVGEIRVQ